MYKLKIYSMKNLLIILLLSYTALLKAQVPEPDFLIDRIKDKIYQPISTGNTYFDLSKKSVFQMAYYETNKPVEEIVGYNAIIRKGSFLNRNATEYLLHIEWNQPTKYIFFNHAENYGPLNQFVVFDSTFTQISEIYFQDATRRFIEVVDIGNTGIFELIMEGYYCGQGFCQNSIEIFYKDFENPALFYISNKECLNSFSSEYEEGKSNYTIEGNKFIININKYTVLRLSENDIRKTKETGCSQIYLFEKGVFRLMSGKNCELESW